MWVTYSGNKEDIWVSRIPVPLRDRVTGPVNDSFDAMRAGGEVTDWNIYTPKWAAVGVADFPSASNKSIELRDKDPYDYARAIRVFPEGMRATIRFKVYPKTAGADTFEIEVTDRYGSRPVRVVFSPDRRILVANGASTPQAGEYRESAWHQLEIAVDAGKGRYSLSIDGKPAVQDAAFAEAVKSVERISFRTGPYRNDPTRQLDRYDPKLKDLAGADSPLDEAVFYIDDFSVQSN